MLPSRGVPRHAVPKPIRAGAVAGIVAGLVAGCENPVAPTSCGPIPQQTVNVGGSARVTVCFNDADGDVLSYAVSSSNESVATATHGGTEVTVTARAPGSTTIAVTAADPDGLQAQQSFAVVVPNRPPRAKGSIAAQQVEVGQGIVIALAPWFEEPDGQSLTFRVDPADRSVAGVALSGSRVTLVGLAKGTTNIMATATDPGGLEAVQVFGFEVPNRHPVALGTIEGQVLRRGETRAVDLTPWFNDPDGDPLAYTASSSSPGVVTATVSGATLRLTVLAAGETAVTVTARDPDGSAATHSFSAESLNRPPLPAGSMPDQAVRAAETARLDVSPYFNDPDGDPLVYTASSSNPSVAAVSTSGPTVTVAAMASGSATITVTATDPGGLSATQAFAATVASRPPAPVGTVPHQSVRADETATLDVSPYFTDPDGDPLTYTASSSDGAVASVEVFGATLELSGRQAGRATITVAAADPGGLSATQTFDVTVEGPPEDPGSFHIDLRFATVMSATQEAAFRNAAARWTAVLADTELPDMPVPEGRAGCRFPERTYEQPVNVVDDLMIIAAVTEIDGEGEILGRAGPCGLRQGSHLPWVGAIEFDAADLDWMETNGALEAVILHEMGHVLGIGTLWDRLGLLRNPSLAAEAEVDTHFSGAQAARAFDGVGGAFYTAGAKVPVENQGTRLGSDDTHWRKNVFGPELMSPSIAPGSSPLSSVTIASLADMGYAVRIELADAYRLPGAATLLAHQRRAIDLGNDVVRPRLEVRDRNGRVVKIEPGGR